MRDNDLLRFRRALLQAEDQLQWGTNLFSIEEAARELRQIAPASLLGLQLEAKLRRIRATRLHLRCEGASR
jgi:hypothetical protein